MYDTLVKITARMSTDNSDNITKFIALPIKLAIDIASYARKEYTGIINTFSMDQAIKI